MKAQESAEVSFATAYFAGYKTTFRDFMIKNECISGLLLSASLFFVAPVFAAATDVGSPAIHLGDSWSYSVSDLWKDVEINAYDIGATETDGDRLSFRVKYRNGAEAVIKYTPELNVCRSMKGETDIRCSAHFKFPLVLGSNTKFSDLPNPPGNGYWQEKCEVADNEKITVPAGTFDTVRVECNGFWSRLSVGASMPLQGRMKETYWYSASVNRWVRYDIFDFAGGGSDQARPINKTRHELVSYKPAQP